MRSNERGSGLVMSLMVLAIFGIVAVGIYGALRYMSRDAVYYYRSSQALGEAEAGVEDALFNLYVSTAWRTGFQSKSLGEGSYTVTLSTEDPPTVTSTGYSGSIAGFGRVARTVQLKAQYYRVMPQPPYQVGWQAGTWTETYVRQ